MTDRNDGRQNQAQPKPLQQRLADAVITGDGFDDIETLFAYALLERFVLAGPQQLYDAEPLVIRGYPRLVAAYCRLLDDLDADEAGRSKK